MRKVIVGLFLAFSFISTAVFAADTYKIDTVHSNIGFSIKHMMVSNVAGAFNKYDGQIIYNPSDLDNSKVNVTIDVASIDTNNEKRDEHLRAADFFEAAKYPTITFVSKKITATEMRGDLTIKGTTKEVTIPLTVTGPIKDMMGNNVIGINGTFNIDRQDYGITWNKTLDQGGLALANDVVVTVSVEAHKEAAAK